MNIFEYAVKNKCRFPYKGMISVEDLFDLSVTELDKVFKTLKSEMKKETEESLLTKMNKEEMELTTKIEIVKTIFNEKMEEVNKRKEALEKKMQREKLLAIKAEKEDAALKNMSLEDIDKMLAELE